MIVCVCVCVCVLIGGPHLLFAVFPCNMVVLFKVDIESCW